jgi:hypothetical protein
MAIFFDGRYPSTDAEPVSAGFCLIHEPVRTTPRPKL